MRISFRVAVSGDSNFFGSQQVAICEVGGDSVVVAEEHQDRWELTKEGLAMGVSAEFCDILSRMDQNVRNWKIPPKMIYSESFYVRIDSEGCVVERNGRPPTEVENAQDAALVKAVLGARSE